MMDTDSQRDRATNDADQSPTHPEWTAEYNGNTVSAEAIRNESVPSLKESLRLSREFFNDDEEYIQFWNEVFRDIINHGSMDLLLYMLDNEGAPVTTVTPNPIFEWATKQLIDALIMRGWDVNTMDSVAIQRSSLIDYFIRKRYGKEDLARWLIEEKGVAVSDVQFNPRENAMSYPPSLLEICAAIGTLPMLRFLEEKGASPSPRMLHVAVEAAAAKGADPNNASPDDSVQMLRYLVDECQMDVNASDIDVPPRDRHQFMYPGTPVMYAARCQDEVSVVRWLLKKGAGPALKSAPTGLDALAYARETRYFEILSKQSRENNPG
ncbi:hypothetical protein F5B18DRAFT_637765 [Nemania serpens]|nr:hypothetical protein F5B18DRAFT_637765 [Nemania serpens]